MCVGTFSGVTSPGIVISSALGGTLFSYKQIQREEIQEKKHKSNDIPL
jgi:hypothetical protein